MEQTSTSIEDYALYFDEAFARMSVPDQRTAREEYARFRQYVASVTSHSRLFRSFIRHAIIKYEDLAEVMSDTVPTNHFIVYLPDINQYGSFTEEKYRALLDEYSRDNADQALSARRVIFTSDHQKIIMLYTETNAITKVKAIEKLAADYFKSGVTILNNADNELEITVTESCVASFAGATDIFQGFIKHVLKKDPHIYANFRQPAVIPVGDKYILKNISILYDGDDTIKDVLSRIPPGTTVNLIIKHNQFNNNVTNPVMNNAPAAQSPETTWIQNNPPGHREKTVVYYKRYTNSVASPTCVAKFAISVRKEGYKTLPTGGSRVWIRG